MKTDQRSLIKYLQTRYQTYLRLAATQRRRREWTNIGSIKYTMYACDSMSQATINIMQYKFEQEYSNYFKAINSSNISIVI